MKKDIKHKPIEKKVVKETQMFSKSSIVNSSKYINKRDALNTILSDDKKYSLDEVDEMLIKFYKTEVK